MYAKAKTFINQSDNLPTLMLYNPVNNSQNVNNARTATPTVFSKGIITGGNEDQFSVCFDENRITQYQLIFDRNGKTTGKAILTFGTCEPPLFIHTKKSYDISRISSIETLQQVPRTWSPSWNMQE